MACLTILSILFFNEIIPPDFTLFGVLNRRGGCVGSAVEDKVLKLPLVQSGMKGRESKRIGQTFPFEKPGREGQIISKSQRQYKQQKQSCALFLQKTSIQQIHHDGKIDTSRLSEKINNVK